MSPNSKRTATEMDTVPKSSIRPRTLPPPAPPPPPKKNPVRPRDKEPNRLVYSVLYKIGLAIGQSLSKLSRTFLTFTEGNANFFVLTVRKKSACIVKLTGARIEVYTKVI